MTPYIIVDVDGVLGDFLTPAMELANRLFKTSFKPEQLDQWDMVPFMKLDEDQEERFYEEIKRPGFHMDIKPYPGAIEGMEKLAELGDIHILTSPMHGLTWCAERWHWLERYFGIHAKDVTHSHAKYKFDADIFIDDKPANIIRWYHERRRRNPVREVLPVLWHQHYTKDHPIDKGVLRVDDWDILIGEIQTWLRAE